MFADRRLASEQFLTSMHGDTFMGRTPVPPNRGAPVDLSLEARVPTMLRGAHPEQAQMWLPFIQALAQQAPDDEDASKLSRWQIRPGSSAQTLLEKVYSMDPFPSMETRRELAKQLHVTPRQVQVWFQNKRQRERKVSRAKAEQTASVAKSHASDVSDDARDVQDDVELNDVELPPAIAEAMGALAATPGRAGTVTTLADIDLVVALHPDARQHSLLQMVPISHAGGSVPPQAAVRGSQWRGHAHRSAA